MPRRLTYEQVREYIEQQGYLLLSKSYKTNSLKLDLQCPQGHKFPVAFNSFKSRGSRCPICAGNVPHTYEYIKEYIEKHNHKLLSKEYHRTHEHLSIECPNGHRYELPFSRFQYGTRCAYCAKKKVSYQQIKDFIEQRGGKLLSTTYKGHTEPLSVMCSNGHQYEVSWRSLQQSDASCRQCLVEKSRMTIEQIGLAMKSEGYELLSSEYTNAHEKLLIKCPKGHQYEATWNKFQGGCRCPRCDLKQSQGEVEVADLYRQLVPACRDRITISPKELDIHFIDKKVAIEYCGLYYHSTGGPQADRCNSSYHRNKMNQCQEKGIRLITIFEDEWRDYKNICISRINNALGLIKNKIYARKCISKQIDKKEANDFLNMSHLQGACGCKVAFGLFHNNELVQVMTFGAPARLHTSKGKKVLEMKRLASKLDCVIVGGAAKLLKLGIEYAKQNECDTIKSYCDLRWGTGNLYAKLDFIKTYETKYTPHYTDCTNRWRNQRLAQNKNKTGTTEAENAKQKGLFKIYDCGHSTWEYKISYENQVN